MLAAAKRRFATEGYEKTTLRAIAQDAHVDPSMVLYLFGSKEELFRESLRLIIDPDVLVAALKGGPDEDPNIGIRMVSTYLRHLGSARHRLEHAGDAAVGHVELRRP